MFVHEAVDVLLWFKADLLQVTKRSDEMEIGH